ncbi:MAG: hypothetical protein R2788_02915 [Saprospiraceae bacterium]
MAAASTTQYRPDFSISEGHAVDEVEVNPSDGYVLAIFNRVGGMSVICGNSIVNSSAVGISTTKLCGSFAP